MGGVSAPSRAKTGVRTLSEPELQSGIDEIKGASAVTAWVRNGKKADDIEMEVTNVIGSLYMRAGYIKLRDRMRSKYNIDERDFVRQLFQRMTSAGGPSPVK